MTNRYGDAPIIYTRVGVILDTLIDTGKEHDQGFSRDRFVAVTGLKESSVRDKLRDMALYGLIQTAGGNLFTITDTGRSIIHGSANKKSVIEYLVKRSKLWDHIISQIGFTPERNAFDTVVKLYPQLNNIDNESLDNLWSAFNADVGCIEKNPPYATRKSTGRIIAKPQISSQQISDQNNPQIPIRKNKFLASPNIMHLIAELPKNEKLTIQYGTFKFEINDKSSAAIAKFLINAKEHGMQFGNDYGQK